MIVRPVPNERLMYEAKKPKPGSRWHRVDLEAFNGHGSCACEHFQIRLASKVRRLQRLPVERRLKLSPIYCQHLEAVVIRWARERLAEISQHMKRQHPDPDHAPHNRQD